MEAYGRPLQLKLIYVRCEVAGVYNLLVYNFRTCGVRVRQLLEPGVREPLGGGKGGATRKVGEAGLAPSSLLNLKVINTSVVRFSVILVSRTVRFQTTNPQTHSPPLD
jgi:hypothetical protein